MKHETPYNPLDKQHLGESVADAMLARPVEPLPPAEPFVGAGIYAIYYVGDFQAYAPLVARNRNRSFAAPIYVGKAVPKGARKGGYGLGASPGAVLFSRLGEHAQSVNQAVNLRLEDFFCRYLAVDDIWVPLGEALLIETYSPVWNVVVDGFGNHDPGGGRRNQQRSPWDMLHPGRAWAEKLPPNARSAEDIVERIQEFFQSRL